MSTDDATPLRETSARRLPIVDSAARFSVAGKSVVVTGGTSGIGMMLARGFVDAHARVAVVSRKPQACAEVARQLPDAGGVCFGVLADLGTSHGPAEMAAGVRNALGTVDVLINNAGITWGAPLEEYPDDAFDRVFAVNVRASFRCAIELLPDLRRSGTVDEPPA